LFNDDELNLFFLNNAPEDVKTLFFMINAHYGPCRADIFRYLVLFLKGGIYLDVKVKCLVPFDKWITSTDEFIFSYWNDRYFQKDVLKNQNGEIQNWFIISKKNHPFLNQVLKNLSTLIKRQD
jgi:mannosyltransferase OCH1-like enzyme